jgi:hypothetical protein
MIKDLVYKPIGNGIMNTRIPVKNGIEVSLSYSLHRSYFSSVGTKEQPQRANLLSAKLRGAIILIHSGIEDLYSFNGENNTKQCETI